MATNQIKTRILNKFDLLSNYNNATNFYPLKGEICIAEIPSTASDSGLTPPAIGIKVGTWTGSETDGSKKNFAQLPWIQAIAGDIPAELKTAAGIDAEIAKIASGRKLATVKELTDFESSINSQITAINEKIGTEISFNKDNSVAKNIKALQDAVGTDASGLSAKVTALENALPVADFKSTTVKQAIADAKSGAISEAATAAAGIYQTKAQATEDHNGLSASISGLSDKIGTETLSVSGATTVISAINKVNSDLGTANQGLSTAQTDIENLKKVTKGYTAEGSIKTAIETADGKGQSALDKIGTATLANGKTTLSEEINAVNERVNTANGNITAVDNRIDAILGDDKVASGAQKTIRQIANEELAAQLLDGADNGAEDNFKTLKELADWLEKHPEDASAMNSAIGDNADAIEALQKLHATTESGYKTVAQEVAAGVADRVTTGDFEAYKSGIADELELAASALQKADIAEGASNGTIAVKGTDVKVHGLGSAAYTEASAYATAAQGSTADSALQNVKVLGTTLSKASNELTVNDAKTALGLKSAAFAETTAFDAAGSAGAVETKLDDFKEAFDGSDLATGNGIIDTITYNESGSVAHTRRQIKPTDMSTDSNDVFIFYCGTASELI